MYILISVCVFLSVTTGEVQRDVLPKDPRAIRHRFKNFGPHQFNYKDSDLGNSQTDADSEDYVAPRLVVRRGRKGDNTSSKIPLPELNKFKYERDEQGRGGTYRYRYKNQEKEKEYSYRYGSGGLENDGIPIIRKQAAWDDVSFKPYSDERTIGTSTES
ncbi:hypothetical protein JTE90_011893 [Oedothorax gibbosus]|uniref:Uncharacterized protein n=1 Tax=Oedothorax gibbosus TaxID=931172 RepID=A0AAV6TY82_9ARAC|nr:hypothetical protein JTE90_011893 [Oedothorax gibbosus]